jgi:hypothetical protein
VAGVALNHARVVATQRAPRDAGVPQAVERDGPLALDGSLTSSFGQAEQSHDRSGLHLLTPVSVSLQ